MLHNVHMFCTYWGSCENCASTTRSFMSRTLARSQTGNGHRALPVSQGSYAAPSHRLCVWGVGASAGVVYTVGANDLWVEAGGALGLHGYPNENPTLTMGLTAYVLVLSAAPSRHRASGRRSHSRFSFSHTGYPQRQHLPCPRASSAGACLQRTPGI